MSWASSEVVSVLTFLLPGFVAAAVFYSLTSHPKPSAFDRVVQALIFTVVGQAIVALLFALGSSAKTDMRWLRNSEPVLSVLIAVILGLVASYASNRDTIHRILRRLGVTRETSYPSEWYSAFSRHHGCFVVLHLKGQRRLYGWPEEWPSHPEEGHFRVTEAEWLGDENERKPATGVAAILIPAAEVEMVEFVSEINEQPEEMMYGQRTDASPEQTGKAE